MIVCCVSSGIVIKIGVTPPPPPPATACTKAVVAIFVELSEVAGVGAVGVPVSAAFSRE